MDKRPDGPFIIAEAGSCHDGDLLLAVDMVELAVQAGADAVKFQYVSSAQRLCDLRKAPEYLEAYKLIELGDDWLPELAQVCDQTGIEFMCTVYLPEDIETVDKYVKRHKVASFEVMDRGFMDQVLRTGKPVIASLGMTSLGERYILKTTYPDVQWLHCVSAYPVLLEQLNLSLMEDGFSDHSAWYGTGAPAVFAGARILEVHFRHPDTSPGNADYAVALDPRALAEYVNWARFAWKMMYSTGDAESAMRKYRRVW